MAHSLVFISVSTDCLTLGFMLRLVRYSKFFSVFTNMHMFSSEFFSIKGSNFFSIFAIV